MSLRVLAKNRSFAAVSLLTLALGIGATTAVFSVVNAVLIRPLPYRDPDRLVMLWGNVERTVVERRGTSIPDFVDWRDKSKSFESMAVVWNQNFTLYAPEASERIPGEVVSASYFAVLGITAAEGRVFLPEEDIRYDGPPVALLGAGLFKRRFGGDAGLVGKTLQMNGRSFTLVGVLPEGFRGMSDEAEIWIPVAAAALGDGANERGNRGFPALARLARGVSREQAQAEMDSIAGQLREAYPGTNEGRGVEVASLRDEVVGDVRPVLIVLFAAVGFVLLIACTNVANLLLARAEARRSEMAVRIALGATPARIRRQLIVETLTLTLIGAALGALLASWSTDALLAASPAELPRFAKVGVDFEVIGFATLVSVLAGLALGIAPTLSPSMLGGQDVLRESTARSGGRGGRDRYRKILVVSEVALAIPLLVGAGLFIRSFQKLTTLHPGFEPAGLLTLRVGLSERPAEQPGTERSTKAVPILLESLAALPSVEAVSFASDLPLAGGSSAIFYTAEGQPEVTAQDQPRAYVHRVTPGFFRTLGARLLRGRDFTLSDLTGDSRAVIVSEGVARRFWPGEEPLGKRIKTGRADSKSPWLEIVGVVGDMNYRALPRNPTSDPDLYFPFSEEAQFFSALVRTSAAPTSLLPALRTQLFSLDKRAVTYNTASMEERVRRENARSRFSGWLMSLFALAALVLTLVGIYGVMTHVVTERTQEIGIRMALGAAEGQVVRMIALGSLGPVGLGLGLGLLVTLALTRLVQSLLFGVSATDPFVLAGGSLLLLALALLAAYVPARRASRLDAVTALRYE